MKTPVTWFPLLSTVTSTEADESMASIDGVACCAEAGFATSAARVHAAANLHMARRAASRAVAPEQVPRCHETTASPRAALPHMQHRIECRSTVRALRTPRMRAERRGTHARWSWRQTHPPRARFARPAECLRRAGRMDIRDRLGARGATRRSAGGAAEKGTARGIAHPGPGG